MTFFSSASRSSISPDRSRHPGPLGWLAAGTPGDAKKHGVFHHEGMLGGSSHLVSGLVHPNYKWINPTYPIYNRGYNITY